MDDSTRELERQYTELGPMLLSYFRRQRVLAQAADDLLQETFLRAWRQRARLRSAVSPRAYLFGIARHVGIDACRRGQHTERLDVEAVAAAAPATDERVEILRVAVASLPKAQREALRLKLQQELTYAEIAEVLDIPVGTVRSRLHHAVKRLHDVLHAEREM